ncbi:MAG: sigma-70 family RNA polymerase sigma factor [Acidobacteria bacterium]|nr:sigma-70 family RNA polymerase sigma factor [Acidobacteriota bacterium]MBV9476823.1 sigma-70 family RNA polymerase sigma factor [Acidobacteriota bacterium]
MHIGGWSAGGRIPSFEDLYQRYYRRVVSYVMNCRFSRDDAQELTQEIFIRVLTHMDTYRGDSEWNFIQTTARRHVSNEIRRLHAKKREAVMSAVHELAHDLEDKALPADLKIERHEAMADRQRKLRAAIAQLPPGSRHAFILRMKGKTYKEIAHICGITDVAARARFHEARVRLKAQVGEDPPGGDDDKE